MPRGFCASAFFVLSVVTFGLPPYALAETPYYEGTPESLRMAIEDIGEMYPGQYDADSYLARLDALDPSRADFQSRFQSLQREALLANPLLDFDRILLIRRNVGKEAARYLQASGKPIETANGINLGLPWRNSQSNSTIGHPMRGWDNDIAVMRNLRGEPKLETLFRMPDGKIMTDLELDFDANRVMFSSIGTHTRWHLFEIDANGTGLRQLTPTDLPDVDHSDSCYLPNGDVVFTSTASYQGLPCEFGSAPMVCLYRLFRGSANTPGGEKPGTIRQLTFEQDSDWHPTVMNSGRVMYLRWEYTDTPHFFTRVLFQMNPDGTGQREIYGSNSYWPNGFYAARPIPGSSSQFVGVVTGHHGYSRMGRLVLLDAALGRREADGVVQALPGRGKKVEPVIVDRLYANEYPKFMYPYPLAEKQTNAGAGRYFLATAKPTPDGLFGVYLVDAFDNVVQIKEVEGCFLAEPIPFIPQECPPVVVDQVDMTRKDATVNLMDIYHGPGLKGIPRGAVKRLRIVAYDYSLLNTGSHQHIGVESSWDIKRVLGTVPVEEDGSANFTIPANTPIMLQPLDEDGAALQLMRSWMVGMPGEVVACTGCHEDQNSAPLRVAPKAFMRAPDEITPWKGFARPFAFELEVQPVLDRYCVGCHDGTERDRSNLTASAPSRGTFSGAYMALQKYVRRPGPEGDYHLTMPMEYHASTSPLVQMLRGGHHGVRLDREAWESIYCWIDLNAPYHGSNQAFSLGKVTEKWYQHKYYTEMKIPHDAMPEEYCDMNVVEGMRQRRIDLAKLYANVDSNPEGELAKWADEVRSHKYRYIAPNTLPQPSVARLDAWPLSAEEAQSLAGERITMTVDGESFDMVRVPAGRFVMGDPLGDEDARDTRVVEIIQPFWMMTTEVTNALYAKFNAAHDSRFHDLPGKDQSKRGYPANAPEQPVVRVSCNEAEAFCEWLSEKTGKRFSLPNEAQWEWAARAGSDARWPFGNDPSKFYRFANLADAPNSKAPASTKAVYAKLNPYARYATDRPDGKSYPTGTGQFTPNAWGLYDMLGNVAEWTSSSSGEAAIARGGSWQDLPTRATVGSRVPYQGHQAVFSVGIRCICSDDVMMAD